MTSPAASGPGRAGLAASNDEPHAGLGLAYGTVALRDHNHSWAAAYQLIAAPLSSYLDGIAISIEHVGSTAVDGPCAKPIIDIAAGLAPQTPASKVCGALAASGWQFRGDKGSGDGGLLFVLESTLGLRIAHLHGVTFDGPAWHAYLTFRDLLRTRPDLRAEYTVLKQQLASQYAGDLAAYTAGKETLVRQLLGR